MTDKQIYDRIAFQVGLGYPFALAAVRLSEASESIRLLPQVKRMINFANLQAAHIYRLIATHRLAIERHLKSLRDEARAQ